MLSCLPDPSGIAIDYFKDERQYNLFRGGLSEEVALDKSITRWEEIFKKKFDPEMFVLLRCEPKPAYWAIKFILKDRDMSSTFLEPSTYLVSDLLRSSSVQLMKGVKRDEGFPFIIDKQLFNDFIGVYKKIKRFSLTSPNIDTNTNMNMLYIGPESFHNERMIGFHRLFIHTFATQLGLHSARMYRNSPSHHREYNRKERFSLTSEVCISKMPLQLSRRNLGHRKTNINIPHYQNIVRVAKWICYAGGKTTPLFVVWMTERKRRNLGKQEKDKEEHILTRLPKDIIGVIDSFLFGGDNLLQFLLSKIPEYNGDIWIPYYKCRRMVDAKTAAGLHHKIQ